jgi:uncharacterized cysteine cluster protein YcgN (CxxCxxCC family)
MIYELFFAWGAQTMNDEFWKRKSLRQMTAEEWEALCDGCALCCLKKVEDEETGSVYFSDIACKLLDTESCRCMDYSARAKKVADCLVLVADKPEMFRWLPATCAYRLVADGNDLPEWHPLLTGNRESVHDAGISVRGRVRSEAESDEVSVMWCLG